MVVIHDHYAYNALISSLNVVVIQTFSINNLKINGMQKLTDIWVNLLGATTRDAEASERERERFDRIERVSDAFHNMYWTRIIDVGN